MLSNPFLDLQSFSTLLDDGKFTLVPPSNIFSSAKAGEVYLLLPSIKLTASGETAIDAELTLYMSWFHNQFGSGGPIVIYPDADRRPFFTPFSPVEFTVVSDGISPLDSGILHFSLASASVLPHRVQADIKCLWSRGDMSVSTAQRARSGRYGGQ